MRFAILLLLIFLTRTTYAQQEKFVVTTFCGKVSSEYDGRSSCSTSELRNCNLVIVPEDTSLHVHAFSLTIVPLNNVGKPAEFRINADRIPADYVEQLCAARAFRIESISILDSLNTLKPVKPIVITVVQ